METISATMETINLKNDLSLFGFQVKTFPNGIEEAFTQLADALPDGRQRDYFGLSCIQKDGSIAYHAATPEKFSGEINNYKDRFQSYRIEKGDYLAMPLEDWRRKTDMIKDVFHLMMQDQRVDLSTYCVEWYQSDEKMYCMIKKRTS